MRKLIFILAILMPILGHADPLTGLLMSSPWCTKPAKGGEIFRRTFWPGGSMTVQRYDAETFAQKFGEAGAWSINDGRLVMNFPVFTQPRFFQIGISVDGNHITFEGHTQFKCPNPTIDASIYAPKPEVNTQQFAQPPQTGSASTR